nr:hypothetical protein [Salmonid herpesvirus 1]
MEAMLYTHSGRSTFKDILPYKIYLRGCLHKAAPLLHPENFPGFSHVHREFNERLLDQDDLSSFLRVLDYAMENQTMNDICSLWMTENGVVLVQDCLGEYMLRLERMIKRYHQGDPNTNSLSKMAGYICGLCNRCNGVPSIYIEKRAKEQALKCLSKNRWEAYCEKMMTQFMVVLNGIISPDPEMPQREMTMLSFKELEFNSLISSIPLYLGISEPNRLSYTSDIVSSDITNVLDKNHIHSIASPKPILFMDNAQWIYDVISTMYSETIKALCANSEGVTWNVKFTDDDLEKTTMSVELGCQLQERLRRNSGHVADLSLLRSRHMQRDLEYMVTLESGSFFTKLTCGILLLL